MPSAIHRWMNLVRWAAALMCTAGLSTPLIAHARQALPQTPKAYLRLTAKELELLWNGDLGEEGRGQGEVFLFTLIYWGAPVEQSAIQRTTLGPLGGPPEVSSGTIVEGPPGQYRVEPTVVTAGLGQVYYNRADCPVPNQAYVYAKVWDDDNNTDVKVYTKLILDGLKTVVDAASSNGVVPTVTDLVSQGLLALVDWLTWSRDDVLGEFSGNVSFPDPCAGPFVHAVELGLDTRCADLWISDALDQNGVSFTSRGIPPPAQIGSLNLQIIGGTLPPDYASSITLPYQIPPPDSNRYWRIVRFDIGQPDECKLTGALDLKAALPAANPMVDLGVYLDTDHNIATGAPSAPARGAEYQIELPLGASYGVVPLLFRYDQSQSQFVPVSGAMVSSEIDLDRGRVFLSTDLASIDSPNDSVAAWATSESSHGVFLSPPDAAVRSPVVTIQENTYGPPPSVLSTYPPSGARDVPVTDSLVIEFTKSMNESFIEGSFNMNPHVSSGGFSFYGDRVTFRPHAPLEPGRVYTATVQYWMTDCVGNQLDGDGDLIGGDAFQWSFTTRPPLLMATNPSGAPKDRFIEGDFIHARGDEFPPNTQVALYVMRYDVGEPADGTPLVDATDNGPEVRTTSLDGFTNVINLGRVLVEGEYNVIVDVDRDGFYGPEDRIDRSAIGFAVFPSGVDGKRDPGCTTSTVAQITQTQFGDSNLGLFDHANGSELDAACARVEDGALKLFLAGNLESNFNKLEIFIDCLPGGQNRLRGDNSTVDFGGLNRMGDNGSGNGLTFDSGFLADYWIGLTGGGGSGNYRLFTNYAELRTNGGGPGFYVGETIAGGDGTLSGGNNLLGIRTAIDNSNTAGVGGGCGTANGDGVATGIEVLIPLAAIGNPTGCIRISALINAISHDFLSNQVLGPLPSGTCNLGEPRTTLLGSIPGNQYFQVCVPTTGVEPDDGLFTSGVRAWPNPFRDQVSIRFDLPPGLEVQAEIFEVTGRRVRSFAKRALPAGMLAWDGRGDRGEALPAGIYLVRVRALGVDRVVRVLRLR